MDENKINHKIGLEIIGLLDLQLINKYNDIRIFTTWGEKTPVGLAHCIKRIIDEQTKNLNEGKNQNDIV